jgi:preprotein translocase subunit SecD
VRGFAFTLGLTTFVDLFVVFFFTKPLVTVLSKVSFYAHGHALSGFSARSLGVQTGKEIA